jgi:glycosyltransferase involved in cell wall biosynthesis
MNYKIFWNRCKRGSALKIAQICPRYFPEIGGVETHVKEISERLVKLGYNVDVITTDPTGRLKKEEIINGVKIIRFKAFAPSNAYYFAPQIYFYLKENKYDVIHAHSYHALPALFASFAADQNRFVFTPHYHRTGHTFFRNILHKPYRLFGKIIFSKADSIICVSGYEKNLVESDFSIAGKTVKIPNGINLQEFKNLKHSEKTSETPQKEKNLLYVGRLEEYKGVQYIIRNLPELQEFCLRIVGKGPYETELRNLAKSLRVEKKVEWLKDISREELLQCYVEADIFLMLSSHEAFGITVAEALAAGTPCIVAKGSALEEFVDGIDCIGIEEPLTEEKVLETLQRARNLKKQINLGKETNLLDWNDVTEKIQEVYLPNKRGFGSK